MNQVQIDDLLRIRHPLNMYKHVFAKVKYTDLLSDPHTYGVIIRDEDGWNLKTVLITPSCIIKNFNNISFLKLKEDYPEYLI
jgi:hypothetical protein